MIFQKPYVNMQRTFSTIMTKKISTCPHGHLSPYKYVFLTVSVV